MNEEQTAEGARAAMDDAEAELEREVQELTEIELDDAYYALVVFDRERATAKAEADKRAKWFEDVRTLLDEYEATDLRVPDSYEFEGFRVDMWGKDEFATAVSQLGGKRIKESTDYSFTVKRQVGPFTLLISSQRGTVCERKLVGTKVVHHTRKVGEDPRKDETYTTTEDEYDWVCPDSVLAATEEESDGN